MTCLIGTSLKLEGHGSAGGWVHNVARTSRTQLAQLKALADRSSSPARAPITETRTVDMLLAASDNEPFEH